MMFAGNLWEWTVEPCYRNGYNFENGLTLSCMVRGGSLNDSYTKMHASYRLDCITLGATTGFGFRVVLFLQ